MSARRTSASSVTPEGAFIVGALSQYIGAAIAVGLFDELSAPGVAWLRVVGAALILAVWRRPWQRRFTRTEVGNAAAFGVVLAGMNLSIYLALTELPLGNAVAIEFLGPIAVAAIGTRTARGAGALLVTVAGVGMLAEVTPEATRRGVGFALLAAALWAGYIVLGHRVARAGLSLDGLALAFIAGSVAIAPFGAGDVGPALDMPSLLLLAAATGLLSNVIPYGIDQWVLDRVTRARFALLQALLPVTATVVGVLALGDRPGWGEVAGIALVIVGLLASVERRTNHARLAP